MYSPQRQIDNKEEYIQQELISIFFRYLGKNIVAVPIVIAMVALFCWNLSPNAYLVTWFILLEATILIGFIPLNRAFKHSAENKTIRYWQITSALLSFLVSTMMGVLPWLVFAQLDSYVVVFISISLCLAPGLIISYSSCHMPIWLGSTIGLITPIMLYSFLNWDFSPNLGKTVAVWMVLCVFGYSYYLALSHHKQLKSYYSLQWDIRNTAKVAQSSLETKHQFLAIMSHDIRQPLDALSILIDLLKTLVIDKTRIDKSASDKNASIQESIGIEKTEEIFNKINSNIKSQKLIYERLLSISKLDTDDSEIQFEPVALQSLFSSLKNEFGEQFQEKSLKITFSDHDFTVFTDRYLCESAIRNLISNAYKYTDKGQVIVQAASFENRIKISVNDTGQGIDADDLKKIFQPFYQAGNAPKNYENGLGLGLNIVSRISDKINGELNVESSVGEGSTFTISLPRNLLAK